MWSALALLDALIAGGVVVDPLVKKLCARIDAQIAKLVSGAAQLQLGRLTDLYLAFFGRAPDVSGLEYWQERLLEEGRDFATISKDFAWSLEAQALFPPAASNREFVRTVYLNCSSAAPNSPALRAWSIRSGRCCAVNSTRCWRLHCSICAW